MSHRKSLDQLKHEIAESNELIGIGEYYRHNKSQHIYKVLGCTVLESTEEIAVRYADTAHLEVEFIRPIAQWFEVVDGVPCFEKTQPE